MAPVKLSQYIMLKGDNGYNLCLHNQEGHPYLCFNSPTESLWSTHEVFPVAGKENVLMIKSLHSNGFWRRSPNWIWADQWSEPSDSNLDCLFQVYQLGPKNIALKCLANNRFVKRLTIEGKESALNAAAEDYNTDTTAQFEFSEASLIMQRETTQGKARIKLPQYIMLKGDNDYNLCLHDQEGHPYLCFNSSSKSVWSAHEVFPVAGKNNVLMIKSVHSGGFWRRSPNWIWADQWSKPSDSNLDCLFQVYQLGQKNVALKCLANNRFLKRLTIEGKESALNAAAEDYNTDTTAIFELGEAVLRRRVFNVMYDEKRAEILGQQPVVLGTSKAQNDTPYKTDVKVAMSYTKTSRYSWKNSTSFTTGLSVTVQAGIPEVASVSSTVSMETTISTEFGKEEDESKSYTSEVTVKDVPQGETITVKVTGVQTKQRVPYKYSYVDTLLNGVDTPVQKADDGVFEGVAVMDVGWLATAQSGRKLRADINTK